MKKTDRMNDAIAALKARDVREYRKARWEFYRFQAVYKKASEALGKQGAPAYKTLERYMVKALQPHRIEWRQNGRSVGGDVNHDNWTISLTLWGDIFPMPKGECGKYRMPIRASVPFSMSPRTGDEFRQMVALLKASADAISEGGL